MIEAISDNSRNTNISDQSLDDMIGWVPLSGDFNSSGMVDFDDFFVFAESFGFKKNDKEYNARFDFNGDEKIDFDDFFVFAKLFLQREIFALNFNEPLKGDKNNPRLYLSSSLKRDDPQLFRQIVQRGSIEDIALRGIVDNPDNRGDGAKLLFSADDINRWHRLNEQQKAAFISQNGLPSNFFDIMRRNEGSGIDILFEYGSNIPQNRFDAYLQVWGVESIHQGEGYAPIRVLLNNRLLLINNKENYRFQSSDGKTGEILTSKITDNLSVGENRLAVSADITKTMPWIKGVRVYIGPPYSEEKKDGTSLAKVIAQPAAYNLAGLKFLKYLKERGIIPNVIPNKY